jgi:hypothetical protein
MRLLAVALVTCLLGLATGCVSPTPSEETLLSERPTDELATPAASPNDNGTSATPVRPLPEATCRGRTDCGPEEVCVARRPGISECVTLLEAGEEEPADGPEGQLAPPAGMLRGDARFAQPGDDQ